MTVIRRLGEVATIIMGQAPPGEAYNSEGTGWPLLSGASDFDGIKPSPKKYTTEASKVSEPGDIILGIRATIGEKVLVDGVYCLGRGVAAIRPSDILDARFLWHWLSYVAPKLAAKGRGATFKQVNRQDIGELPIGLPPLDEQQRVAAVLDAVDALREQRRGTLTLWDRLAQSVFVNMLDSSQSPAHADLGNYLSFVTSGGRGWAKYYSESGSRFIRSLDVRMNEIANGAAVYVTPPDNAEAKRTRVRAGDVLLTITGSLIGRVAPVTAELEGSYISQHVAILRSDQTRMLPEFLSFFLSLSTGGQRQIARLQYGQTKPGLNFEQIRKFRVPVLSIVEQYSFVEKLSKIMNIAAVYREHLGGLDELSASLQSRAFAGEL